MIAQAQHFKLAGHAIARLLPMLMMCMSKYVTCKDTLLLKVNMCPVMWIEQTLLLCHKGVLVVSRLLRHINPAWQSMQQQSDS